MPMPQLNVRSISASAMPPAFASQLKTGGTGICARSSAMPRFFGKTRGRFSGKPPPVMCASALMFCVSLRSRRVAASRRCASASAALRRANAYCRTVRAHPKRGLRVQRSAAPARNRWNARPKTAVRRQHRLRRHRRAATGARARPRRPQIPRDRSRLAGIEARHFRRLAADQRATRLAAALRQCLARSRRPPADRASRLRNSREKTAARRLARRGR